MQDTMITIPMSHLAEIIGLAHTDGVDGKDVMKTIDKLINLAEAFEKAYSTQA